MTLFWLEPDEPDHPKPLPPLPEWTPLPALPPQTERRVKDCYYHFACLHAAFNTYVRSKRFGLAEPKGASLKGMLEEMRRINDELDHIAPPDEDELARRAAEATEQELRFARERELAPLIADYRRNMRMAKRLLGDVLVDRRYAQIARSATEFAVRRLAPGGKPPQIRFFHSNGTTKGFFDRREPGWINIAEGLSDIELVRTCMHEASHSVTPAGGTETIAQYDETWLAREYCADHGWNTSHGWEACA